MSKRAEKAANEIYKDGIELLGRRDKNGNLIIHPETMIGILRNACQRGYDQAEKDIKAQILEGAVEGEGEVVKDINNKLAVTAKNVNLDRFNFGDKVRIIVLSKEEK